MPALAFTVELAEKVAEQLHPEINDRFNPRRYVAKPFRDMTTEEKFSAIDADPDYARIVCHCQLVTEAEIRDAICGPLGASSVAGVALRTKAGMGKCQGGFCSPRVVEILAEELEISPLEVTQCGGSSRVLLRKANGSREVDEQ